MDKFSLIIIALIFSVTLFADETDTAEYRANYDKCWRMLYSTECNKNLLTEEDFFKIENKYGPVNSIKNPIRTPEQNTKARHLSTGESVILFPDQVVNSSSGQSIKYFRRGEVPAGYEGDFVIIDEETLEKNHNQRSDDSMGRRISTNRNSYLDRIGAVNYPNVQNGFSIESDSDATLIRKSNGNLWNLDTGEMLIRRSNGDYWNLDTGEMLIRRSNGDLWNLDTGEMLIRRSNGDYWNLDTGEMIMKTGVEDE